MRASGSMTGRAPRGRRRAARAPTRSPGPRAGARYATRPSHTKRLCRPAPRRWRAAWVRTDPTEGGRRHGAARRASIPDAEHKAEAWQLITQSQELGHEGVMAVASGFGQPEHAELLAPYVDAYFEVLPEIWASRGDHIR